MISLYSGTPGSGKSYHCAKKIYDLMKYHDGVIIGNFQVNLNAIKGKQKAKYIYCDNSRLEPERIFNFCRHYNKHYYKGAKRQEGRYILIIDESQMLLNAREWQANSRKGWLKFFTHHRKVLLDIILIAQFDRMLDRNVRACVEYEYVHRKVSNYGIFGKFLGLFFKGNFFVCIQRWYPLKERLASEFVIGRKKYFEIYNTDDLFDGA